MTIDECKSSQYYTEYIYVCIYIIYYVHKYENMYYDVDIKWA